MTTPGNPQSSLGKALDNYSRVQDVMKYAGSTIRRAREEGKTLDEIFAEDKANGTFLAGYQPPD